MKKLLLTLLFCFICTSAYSATITFTIPDNKISDVADTMKWLFPIPQIPNPAFIDYEQTPDEPLTINEFTDNEWAKEAVRRWLIAQVKRHKDYLAKEAINNPADNTLVT